MGNVFYFQWEIALTKWMQYNANDLTILISKFFSVLGSEIVLTAIIMVVYLGIDKNLGRKIMINTTIALNFGCALKSVIRRLRPYFVTDEVKCLVPVDNSADMYDISAQGYSFPSLHSLNAICVTGSLYKFTKKNILLIFAIVFSMGIGLTRIVTANHFPTDVLTGWIIGIIALELIPILEKKLGKRKFYFAFMIIFLCCFIYCRAKDLYLSYGIMSGFFFSDLFEEKYVNFKETHNPIRIAVRLSFGVIIFLVLIEVFKLIIPSSIVSGSIVSYLFESLRYGLGVFATFGLYPLLFEKNILKFKD
ncbi:MAG: phosphatase PAP2 family protein [Erysipelotrichaceae bacterium]|nr:phosphatase PAP2 family protein [Erysipelotrichaceae bacterium]